MLKNSPRNGIWLMLSERERQIVMCAREGLIDKEIARKLNIGMGTVRTYWERIRTKTGARSRAELVSLIGTEDMNAVLQEVKNSQDVLASIIDNSSFGLALYSEEDEDILHANKIFHDVCEVLAPTIFVNEPLPNNLDFDNQCSKKLLQIEFTEPRSILGPRDSRYRISSARFDINSRPVTLIQLDDVTQIEQSFENPQQKNLPEIFANTRTPLLVTTRLGHIIYASERAQSLLERNRRDLIARKFQDLMIPVDEPDWHRLVVTTGCVEAQFRYVAPNLKREMRLLAARMTNRLSDKAVRGITVTLGHRLAFDPAENN